MTSITLTANSKPFAADNGWSAQLIALLAEYDCRFFWDGNERYWFLAGTDRGNAWETDNYEAQDLEDAIGEAIAYLEAYNEPADA